MHDSIKKLNLGFAGTPAFGLPALAALYQAGYPINAVYTQPDRPAGRGRKLQASPIKQWAIDHQIPVYQPLNFKQDQDIQTLESLNLDLLIVIAYGLILPPRVLAAPKYGCINVHASLLPRWRGASPIQQAILHGDQQTGVAIMQMDKGLDTGNVFHMTAVDIDRQDTAQTLHDKLAHLAVSPLLETLNEIARGTAAAHPQDHAQATYAPKITKEEARISWGDSAQMIDQKIRAFNPWPIAFTYFQETPIRIYQASPKNIQTQAAPGTILSIEPSGLCVAAGEGILEITLLQLPGAKALSVKDWYHANRDIKVGMQLQ